MCQHIAVRPADVLTLTLQFHLERPLKYMQAGNLVGAGHMHVGVYL